MMQHKQSQQQRTTKTKEESQKLSQSPFSSESQKKKKGGLQSQNAQAQQMMNQESNPQQFSALKDQQNIGANLIHDSEAKSLSIHESQDKSLSQKGKLRKSPQQDDASSQLSGSVQDINKQKQEPWFQFDNEKEAKDVSNKQVGQNIGQKSGRKIPVVEISLQKLIDKDYGQKVYENPEQIHEAYVKDTSMFYDPTNSSSLSDLETMANQQNNEQQEANAPRINLKSAQNIPQKQNQGFQDISEPPRGTFGDSKDWKDFDFPVQYKQDESKYQTYQQRESNQYKEQFQNNAGKELRGNSPLLQQYQIKKQEGEKSDSSLNQDQQQQWSLIDKLKFAMYNKIYKMFAEEQKDLRSDEDLEDEFDEEIEKEENLIQEAKNREETSKFEEGQQKYFDKQKIVKHEKGQQLMRRFQTAIRRKLQEMKKEESSGIIFRDEDRQGNQQQFQRRKLQKEDETHVRSKSPQRILDLTDDLLKNKQQIIEQKKQMLTSPGSSPRTEFKATFRRRLADHDYGHRLIAQTQPTPGKYRVKRFQDQWRIKNREQPKQSCQQDKCYDMKHGDQQQQILREGYEKQNDWCFQKDRSHIEDGFACGDLGCLFDESQIVESLPVKMQKGLQQRLDDIKRNQEKSQIQKCKNLPEGFEFRHGTLEQQQLKEGYDCQNGWCFQIDRSNIDDGFEEGELESLFDESDVIWEFSRRQPLRKFKKNRIQRFKKLLKFERLNKEQQFREKFPLKEKAQKQKHVVEERFGDWMQQEFREGYEQFDGWSFQKDRTNINDGFCKGDLEWLFDESDVVESIRVRPQRGLEQRVQDIQRMKERIQIKKPKILPKGFDYKHGTVEQQAQRQGYECINGWWFQKDRSQIIDGFQCGDLECLFDESNVQEWIPRKKKTRKSKQVKYSLKNKQQTKELFDKWKNRAFDNHQKKVHQKQNFDENHGDWLQQIYKPGYECVNGWCFQKDRSNINDGITKGDLGSLFNEDGSWLYFPTSEKKRGQDERIDYPTITYKPDYKIPLPNELDYKEYLMDLQKKRKNRRNKNRKQQNKALLEEEENLKKNSPIGYELFGDPQNLSHKTMATSEDHLIITPQVRFDRVFIRESQLIAPKPTLEERQAQSLRDKDAARLKKQQEDHLKLQLQQKEKERLAEQKLKQKSSSKKQQTLSDQKQSKQVYESPVLTLNQKKKIKRKERKLRMQKQQRDQELWESLDNEHLSSKSSSIDSEEIEGSQQKKQIHIKFGHKQGSIANKLKQRGNKKVERKVRDQGDSQVQNSSGISYFKDNDSCQRWEVSKRKNKFQVQFQDILMQPQSSRIM